MVMRKVRPLILATLAVLFSLGAAPLAKADVEMTVDPYAVFTSPGLEMEFTLAIINHDRVSYRCRLVMELWTPNYSIINYPDRYFTLRAGQNITREVNRIVPVGAPMGEYVVWFNLYDESTGGLLASTHVHIFVGWDHL